MQLGCIADDLTGASDLANELVRRGLRTIQVIGIPAHADLANVDAVVVSLKSRSIAPEQAVEKSLAALAWLRKVNCPRFYFKYCSTFDSTPAGNIGPVLEALAGELDVRGVIACPAFPATGRTVYQGYLFVGDRLLHESGMEHHPLTPMTDANLVRVLQAQMRTKVGHLARSYIVESRVASRMADMIERGIGAVIADAVDDAELEVLGDYCRSVPLSSGGSGLGAGLATALAGPGAPRASASLPAVAGRRAIVSGSCSAATRRQVALARERYPSLRIALSAEDTLDGVIARGRGWIDAQEKGEPVLIYSTASPEEVAAQRAAWGDDASAALEKILAELAAYLIDGGVDALLVAGGETSGAVVERLGSDRLAIGPEIDPGVPWLVGRHHDGTPMVLALKSGNFGGRDFFTGAFQVLAS